nr:putative ribonuclease H-like domain-containing protein [Tanacetum cinerariifolium]
MYGLHQAPRAWYGTLSKYFLTNGFQRGTIDQTLFIRRNRGDFILVQVYVDDIIFKSSNPQLCKEFEALMHEKFQMSAMGELNFFLGLQVLQKKDGIFLSQDKYVGDILNKFGYSDTIVATSTTEAEYVTAASCCGQVLWIQNQLLDYGEVPIKPIYPLCNPNNTVIMARLAFCDYHNMIAILEKYEQNSDFHPIVDFVEASHIRRNLKLNDEAGISSLLDAELFENLQLMGYNILPNQKFTFQKGQFSHHWKYLIHTIMQCLSPKSTGFNEFIATALVCLATNRVYNFSKMIFDGRTVPLFPSMLVTMGEGSGTPTKPHHTPTPEATPSPQHELSLSSLLPVTTESLPAVIPFDNPPLRQYTSRTRIAQSSVFPPVVDEPASPFGDDCQGEAFPTDSSFGANQDRANIAKTSPLPSDSTPRVTSLVDDKGRVGNHKFEGQVKLLEDREGGGIAQSEDDALIKGRSLDEGEEAAERVSDDTEEMATVLTFMDAASILTTGGVQVVPTATEVATATVSIPTGSGVVSTTSPSIPTTAPIFTTATESTPYTRRKGKETMVESETPKKKIARDAEIARIHAEEKLQMLIDGLDRNNETVAKYLQEYHQFAAELPIERRIELIMLKSHAGWKARHFKGMTLEEIKEKFDPVWKQFQDFIPIGFKEEAERFKRKGVRLEQDSFKKLKTSEEVPEEKLKEMMELIPVEEVYVEALQVKHPIIDWDVHTEGERSYWKIIRLGGSSASYHFFVDLLKHLDREDLNQLWALVKETLNIIPATNNKEKEI